MRTLGKALSVVAVAAALSATTMASPASAAVTIKVESVYTRTVWEGAGTQFTCPTNQVITGRSHFGDEGDQTTYYCSRILINDEVVEVHAGDWTAAQRESRSDYSAPDHQVVVGRWHKGDENGETRYRSAALYWQGRQVWLANGDVTGQYTESNHKWQAKAGTVMTGRTHYGDENGKTTYRFATVYFEG
ncbi:hypothetical protein [Microbispora sp. H10670]|uniref:hypothetical protein n=1 Tax=Microbispora sp. H10670 TaxID=2729108 RepID=UPI001600EEA5|nr:hypothetical protein [Microbispora sp. H10670]